MIAAWGIFAPIGILLALYYKVVWPNGEWLYVSFSFNFNITPIVNDTTRAHTQTSALQAHIVVMVITLLLTLGGVAAILVHAKGTWLATTVSCGSEGERKERGEREDRERRGESRRGERRGERQTVTF